MSSQVLAFYHDGDSHAAGGHPSGEKIGGLKRIMTTCIRVFAVFIVLALVGATALFIYGQSIPAPTAPVEKVLPDEQFPR